MKRFLAVGLALGLVAGALAIGPAEAKKKKRRVERKVEHEYSFGAPGVEFVGGVCPAGITDQSGCIDFPTSSNELFVTVKVEDSSGSMPYTILAQDTDGDGTSLEIFAEFCGETSGPVPITPGLELRVSARAGVSSMCGLGATSGKITAVVSNLP